MDMPLPQVQLDGDTRVAQPLRVSLAITAQYVVFGYRDVCRG
ncbi:hypothetical protein [Streptomyces sp. NPDC097640]